MLKENKNGVNRSIKNFLPKKVNEKWLRQHFGESVYDINAVNEFLTKPVWDFLDRGGKRWRPLLMFLACGAVGGKPNSIRKFAVIPELLHNGSLIADDIEDGSAMRRHKPSLHLLYGLDIAVNVSSMLYYLPLSVIKTSSINNDVKAELYELVNDEMLRLHVGQGTDIYWHKANNKKALERQYIAMCINKSGTLLRLSAKMGAILGKGANEQIYALGKFAESLGVAFQIQDDILNLSGGLGKRVGDDITEGKLSLPVIRTLAVAQKDDRKMLINILNRHTSNKNEINTATKIIDRYGGGDLF